MDFLIFNEPQFFDTSINLFCLVLLTMELLFSSFDKTIIVSVFYLRLTQFPFGTITFRGCPEEVAQEIMLYY